MPAPELREDLLLALAERADVIVDFTGLQPGTEVYLINLGPDEPFGGGVPGIDFTTSDPGTTGQVMKFRIVGRGTPDGTVAPADLELPALERLT